MRAGLAAAARVLADARRRDAPQRAERRRMSASFTPRSIAAS